MNKVYQTSPRHGAARRGAAASLPAGGFGSVWLLPLDFVLVCCSYVVLCLFVVCLFAYCLCGFSLAYVVYTLYIYIYIYIYIYT